MESKLKSHKDKYLIDHLYNVADSSKRIIHSKYLDLKTIEKSHLANISYLIGIAHDFGKATNFFQEHLHEKAVSQEKKAHSPISSYFGYLIIKDYCNKNNVKEIFSFIGAFLIKRHHGNLGWVKELVASESHINKFKEQLSSMDNEEIQNIYGSLLKGFDIDFLKIFSELESLDFKNFFFDEIFNKYRELKREIDSRNLSYELFLITELLFSVLVDCDKKDAANLDNNIDEKQTIPEHSVELFLEKQRKENPEKFNPEDEKDRNLVELKNRVFNSCVNNEKLDTDKKVYSITAPTGIGKTFTSFATALKLKEKIRKEMGKDFQINYVLPFTTIIDQNYKEFYDILKNSCQNFIDHENDYLIKHHYLTNQETLKKKSFEKKREGGEAKSEDYLDNLLFVKSWDSRIVVSSYVQLMHTILGGKNSFMNKFHNIVNSIIILDEVQCISLKYWELVRDVFRELSEKFGVYFIFLTATQPMIFDENKEEITELSDKSVFKDKLMDRVELLKDLDKEKTIDELYESFKATGRKEDRCLFVLNTKRSSMNLYKKISEENDYWKKQGYEIFYLSTNLTKNDRDKKLKKILGEKDENGEYKKEKKPLKKFILVTTQLIEAGVDISSDICYRDKAPIDSIIQTAGRINRFGERREKGKGKLNLIMIKEEKENSKYYPHKIYDRDIIQWTTDVLNEFDCKSSKQFLETCKKFYSKFINETTGKTKKHSDHLIEATKNLRFDKILDKKDGFKFIDSLPTHAVFILNDDSRPLIKEYRDQHRNKPKTECPWSSKMKDWKGKLKQIRKKFSLFTIEISPNDFAKKQGYLKNNIRELGEDFWYLDIKEFKELYSEETGFNLNYEGNNEENIL